MSTKKPLVVLACLEKNDRQWILNSLASGERKLVEEQLNEIDKLGLNRDPTVLGSLMDEMQSNEEKPILPSELSGIADIDNIDIAWKLVLAKCMEPKDKIAFSKKHNIEFKSYGMNGAVPVEFRKHLLDKLRRESIKR